jgi:glycosyl transferase family 25
MKAFYINLDYRIDRKEQIQEELNKKEIPFERFPAIYHEIGSIGCSKSHLNAIKLARDRKYKNIIIFEDDFEFIVNKDEFYQEMKKLNNINFDACLLSYNTNHLYKYNDFLYKIKDAQTTSGYIVNSHYYDTLINYWEKSINVFEKLGKIGESKYTCDQSWKKLQERDNWYCFKKRIGKQRNSYSDIEKRIVNYNV